jgi:hypothetical protein
MHYSFAQIECGGGAVLWQSPLYFYCNVKCQCGDFSCGLLGVFGGGHVVWKITDKWVRSSCEM